jgi:hypothetical protein
VIERTERLHNGWEDEGIVNWLRKVFASKPNTSNTMTSEEFGGLCIDGVSSFMLSLDSPELREGCEFTDKKKEINQIELLIAFMWLFFDRTQSPKYAKGFTRFHSRFMAHIGEAGLEESETWQIQIQDM